MTTVAPVVVCPLCGGMDHQVLWRHTNRLFGSHNVCEMLECRCGMLLTSPQLDEQQLADLYTSETYYTHIRSNGWASRARNIWRRCQMRGPLWRLRLVVEHCGFRRHLMRFSPKHFDLQTGMRFLDFGCGSGQTLDLLRHLGLDLVGVEPDPKARKVASTSGAEVISTLAELDGKFDRVLMSHVLEHLCSPREMLKELRLRLSPRGRILIRVPNAASAQAEIYGRFWIGYDMPRHLWHFTASALCRLLESSGLRVVHSTSIELPEFARASAQQMRAEGVSPPVYRPSRYLEAQGRGTELVIVAVHSN